MVIESSNPVGEVFGGVEEVEEEEEGSEGESEGVEEEMVRRLWLVPLSSGILIVRWIVWSLSH